MKIKMPKYQVRDDGTLDGISLVDSSTVGSESETISADDAPPRIKVIPIQVNPALQQAGTESTTSTIEDLLAEKVERIARYVLF